MPPIRTRPHTALRIRQGGYNLIEISLACFILGIGIVSILSLFPVALSMADNTVNRKAAAFAADAVRTHIQYSVSPGIDIEPSEEFVCPSTPINLNDAIVTSLLNSSDSISRSGTVGLGTNRFEYRYELKSLCDHRLLNCTIDIFRNTAGDGAGTEYYGVFTTLINRNAVP